MCPCVCMIFNCISILKVLIQYYMVYLDFTHMLHMVVSLSLFYRKINLNRACSNMNISYLFINLLCNTSQITIYISHALVPVFLIRCAI